VKERFAVAQEEKTALCIVAHADDIEFDGAGMLALWIREGWRVYYVICTDGSGGGPDDATDVSAAARQRVIEIRQQEQRAAAQILGVQDVIFLGYPDGELQPDLRLQRELVRLLRQYRPARVLFQSPDRTWTPTLIIQRYHPDHMAAGQAALSAVYPASQNPWAFPDLFEQGFKPHKVDEVYITNAPILNYIVDITEVMDLKMAALRAHVSQMGEQMVQMEQLLRSIDAETGQKYGYTYAEAYHRIDHR